MLRTQGIAHFTLPVSDLTRSIAFYTEILGLEFIRRGGKNLVFLRSGKDHLILAHSPELVPGPPAPGKTSNDVHQAFIVESRDFESSVEFLKKSGVNVFYQDERTDGAVFAGRSAYFFDPDNNVLEIIDLAAMAFRPMQAAAPA